MKKGYILSFGNKLMFFETTKKIKCKTVVDAFINALCDYRGLCDDIRRCALQDIKTRNEILRRIDAANVQYIKTPSGYEFLHFAGRNFMLNYPPENYDEILFIK